MEIQISLEKKQFTVEKINQLEQRMRAGAIGGQFAGQVVKKKIEPIMIQQSTMASLKPSKVKKSKSVEESSDKENDAFRRGSPDESSRRLKSEEKFVRKSSLKQLDSKALCHSLARKKAQTEGQLSSGHSFQRKEYENDLESLQERQKIKTRPSKASNKQKTEKFVRISSLLQKISPDKNSRGLTLENQIALQRAANKSRKITEYFTFLNTPKAKPEASPFAAFPGAAKALLSNEDLIRFELQKMKKSSKIQELGKLKLENQLEALRIKYANLKRDVSKSAQNQQALQERLIERTQSFEKRRVKFQRLLLEATMKTVAAEREQEKCEVQKDKYRLGDLVTERQGHRFVEVWKDSGELLRVKTSLQKKQLALQRLSERKKAIVSQFRQKAPCAFGQGVLKKNTLISQYMKGPETGRLGSAQVQKQEALNRIHFQRMIVQKEIENETAELKALEVQKTLFVKRIKRLRQEESCRFNSGKQKWPMFQNRYQIVKLLGKGGFSEVYKAFDVQEMRWVACKIHQLQSNWSENTKSNYIKHALRENKIHSELDHANIVKLYDTLEIDKDSFCTVLEYCEGEDLSLFLKRNGRLDETLAKCIAHQLIAAINYLNSTDQRVIHYDIKPQNVLFHRGQIKITDFGLCKVMQQSEVSKMQLTSQGVGTYWYLPPECFMFNSKVPPKISSKVDVFSIGVILYEMLQGQKPFGHNMSQEMIYKEQVMLKARKVEFRTDVQISAECREVIRQMLAYNQDERIDIKDIYNHSYFKRKSSPK